MLITASITGHEEKARMIRRTLARWLVLLQVITWQSISTSVRRRFPKLINLEEIGIMTREERLAYEAVPANHGRWWTPAVWCCNLLVRARREGHIKDDILLYQLLEEMQEYRACLGWAWAYDWISIPLVYTQVVTIATYTYFLTALMSGQYLVRDAGDAKASGIDLYIPVFTILEFFFFMGWLKVAEQLINPLGEDDDDFELNWCIDRNLFMSLYIVDDLHDTHPSLTKDPFWDETEPMLPYTKRSAALRSQPFLGSAMNLNVEPEQKYEHFVPEMDTINEMTYREGDEECGINIQHPHTRNNSKGSSQMLNILYWNHERASGPTAPFTLRTPRKRSKARSMADSLNGNMGTDSEELQTAPIMVPVSGDGNSTAFRFPSAAGVVKPILPPHLIKDSAASDPRLGESTFGEPNQRSTSMIDGMVEAPSVTSSTSTLNPPESRPMSVAKGEVIPEESESNQSTVNSIAELLRNQN